MDVMSFHFHNIRYMNWDVVSKIKAASEFLKRSKTTPDLDGNYNIKKHTTEIQRKQSKVDT